MTKLTRDQRKSLKEIYDRQPLGLTYRQFRRTAVVVFDCVMVPWCGMYIGIEPDGYAHT